MTPTRPRSSSTGRGSTASSRRGGTRFHVAEIGDGPLVLFMHGFPQFWFTWRHQLGALAEAGYRAVAMDLRGYGATDKPPRGYSHLHRRRRRRPVIRSLGEDDAIVVGQGSAGSSRGRCPNLEPGVAAPSRPCRCRTRGSAPRSVLDHRQRRRAATSSTLQRAVRPRAQMSARTTTTSRRSCASGPRRSATTRPRRTSAGTPRRWLCPSSPTPRPSTTAGSGGSQLRQDGPLFNKRIAPPVTVPVLQLLGAGDGCVLADCTRGSADTSAARMRSSWSTGRVTSSPRRRRTASARRSSTGSHRRLTTPPMPCVAHNADMSEWWSVGSIKRPQRDGRCLSGCRSVGRGVLAGVSRWSSRRSRPACSPRPPRRGRGGPR